jgi:predicted transcriptional regulator
MKLSDQLKKRKPLTIYQTVANEFGVCEDYVGRIARGQRLPNKKKGLAIKQRLEALTN